MKKANINEAIFDQMAYGADWGQATFWETLLFQEGLGPYEERTVKCGIKRDPSPKRSDYFMEED